MKLPEKYFVQVMVLLLILLGLAAGLFTWIEAGRSAILIFVVFASLIVQIVHFHLLTGHLRRLEQKVGALTPGPEPRGASPQLPAPSPPSVVPHSKPSPGSPAPPIHGSSKNPPPARQNHSGVAQPQTTTPSQRVTSPTLPAQPEETFNEDLAANRQATLDMWAEQERQEGLRSSLAATNASALELARDPVRVIEPEVRAVPLNALEIAQIWNRYLAGGNGQFDSKGLREYLSAAGIKAAVLPPDNLVGMGNPVLGVAEPESRDRIFLLPDFTRPPKALTAWFDLDSEIRSATRMNRLVRVAELRRSGESYELKERGAIE